MYYLVTTRSEYFDPYTSYDLNAFHMGGFGIPGALMPPYSGSLDSNLRAVPVDGEPGCRYCWCLEQKRMTIPQFMVGFFVGIAGYPYSTAIIASLFSKVIGTSNQVLFIKL